MRFPATIRLNGKTACGIQVPEEIVAGLSGSRRPAVKVTIQGYTYRTSIAHMGDEFLISVSAETRAGAGVKAGDRVEVDVELDSEPRLLSVPAELAVALEADPDARATFDSLSYSRRQRLVIPIENGKAAVTRQRQVAKAMSELRDRNS